MNLDKKDRALLEAMRGGFRPLRETLDATGIKRTTAYRHIEALLKRGALEKQGARYRTTDVGLAALEAGPATEATAPSPMDAVSPHLAACPTAVHRALLELMLAAWVARTHDVSPDAQFSFVVFGPTMRWKTWLARLFATLIGESCDEVLLLLSAETGRSVFTRRGSRGETSWQRLVLDRGCVVFDEFQDAAPDVKRLCKIYLQGSMRVAYENESILVRPVPVFTLNDRPADSLAGRVGMAEAQLRRSIPCDLNSVSIPKRLWTRGEEILAAARLETPLTAPSPRLSTADAAKKIQPLVRQKVRSTLLPRIDVQRLATIASGMSAWVDGLAAVERTVECYLRVIETLGWTRTNYAVPRPRPEPRPGSHDLADRRVVAFLRGDSPPEDPRLDFDGIVERLADCLRVAGLANDDCARFASLIRELRDAEFTEVLRMAHKLHGFPEALAALDQTIRSQRSTVENATRRLERLRTRIGALGANEREARRCLQLLRLLNDQRIPSNRISEFLRQHQAIRARGLSAAMNDMARLSVVIDDLPRLETTHASTTTRLRRAEDRLRQAKRELQIVRRRATRLREGWSLLFKGSIPHEDAFWSHIRELNNPLLRIMFPAEAAELAAKITARITELSNQND